MLRIGSYAREQAVAALTRSPRGRLTPALERASGHATTALSPEAKTWSQTSGKEPSPGKTGADHAESGRLPSESHTQRVLMRADLR